MHLTRLVNLSNKKLKSVLNRKTKEKRKIFLNQCMLFYV